MDFNGNGLQDSGDSGVANVTVKLLDAAGAWSPPPRPMPTAATASPTSNPGQYSLQFDKASAYYYTGRYDWWGNAP